LTGGPAVSGLTGDPPWPWLTSGMSWGRAPLGSAPPRSASSRDSRTCTTGSLFPWACS
jgi:hypothetical protein